MSVKRCSWVTSDQIYIDYHDNEWGVPCYDSQDLFAQLMLEGQQAGLSWLTILRRRETYYAAYADFDPFKVASFDKKDVARLMEDAGIIRHRLKVEAMIHNAKCFVRLHEQGVNFAHYLWGFVSHQVEVNHWADDALVPTLSSASVQMSISLKSNGFKYVGPTICYAFMQAVGMVNDHILGCLCRDI